MAKPEVHNYKSTGATCALDKDKITTKELIQYHEQKIALSSEKNKSEKVTNRDNLHLKDRYNNKNLFQNMLFENIGYNRGETPVIPYTRMEETKLHKVSITEVDLDDDDVTDDNEEDEGTIPPSTPCVIVYISFLLGSELFLYLVSIILSGSVNKLK